MNPIYHFLYPEGSGPCFLEIGPNAIFKILGLPHIENISGHVLHQVDPRGFREKLEFFAEREGKIDRMILHGNHLSGVVELHL
jgi:hypothetical protein